MNNNRNANKISDYFQYQTDTNNQGNPAFCNTHAYRVLFVWGGGGGGGRGQAHTIG